MVMCTMNCNSYTVIETHNTLNQMHLRVDIGGTDRYITIKLNI